MRAALAALPTWTFCSLRRLAADRGAHADCIRLLLLLACSLAPFAAPAGARAAAPAQLVVVVTQSKVAPGLKKAVGQHVEKPLRSVATLLSYRAYRAAARVAGIRSNALDSPEAAILGGRGVGATHVVIVGMFKSTASQTPPSRRLAFGPGVQLIDATTGEILLSRRYPPSRAGLTDATARLMVEDIAHVLAGAEPLTAPVQNAPAAAVAPVPQPSPPGSIPELPPPLVPVPSATPAPAPPPDLGAATASPTPLPAADAPATSGPPAPPPEASLAADSNEGRPALRLFFGPLVYTRRATLHASAGGRPASYAPPPGQHAPFFARFVLDAEVYPLAFGGRGVWYEGFGLHGQANVGWAKTALSGGGSATNAVGGASGGAQYRWTVASGRGAPDLLLRGGLSRFAFPLSRQVPFVSVGYEAPYVGLGFAVPLSRYVALTLDGQLLPHVVGFGGTEALGLQSVGGWGYNAQMGARLTVLDNLSVKLLGNVEQYRVPFVGATRLPGSVVQFDNVTLQELMWGVTLAVGLTI